MTLWLQAVNAAAALVTVTALLLWVLAMLAFRRERRTRFFIAALAFGALFAKGVAFSLGLFWDVAWSLLAGIAVLGDAVVLLLMYLAIVR